MSRTYTLDDIMATSPCNDWPRERVAKTMCGRSFVTVEEIATAAEVGIYDRIWLLIALLPPHGRRLFTCWCVRQPDVWGLLHDKRSRKAVVVAERYARGEATEEELRAADDAARAAWGAAYAGAARAAWGAAYAAAAAASRAAHAASCAAYACADAADDAAYDTACAYADAAYADDDAACAYAAARQKQLDKLVRMHEEGTS